MQQTFKLRSNVKEMNMSSMAQYNPITDSVLIAEMVVFWGNGSKMQSIVSDGEE